MQYKIQGSKEQIEQLATHVFNDHTHEIKNNILVINTQEDYTTAFFSMVKAFTEQPVAIDFMTRDLIKFVIL